MLVSGRVLYILCWELRWDPILGKGTSSSKLVQMKGYVSPQGGILYICWAGMLFPLPLALAARMIAVLATHKLLVETECNFTFIWMCLSSFLGGLIISSCHYGRALLVICPNGTFICVASEQNYSFWVAPPAQDAGSSPPGLVHFFVGNPDLNLRFPLLLGGGRPKFIIYLLLFGDSNAPTMLQISGIPFLYIFFTSFPSGQQSTWMNWWKPANGKSKHPQEVLDSE